MIKKISIIVIVILSIIIIYCLMPKWQYYDMHHRYNTITGKYYKLSYVSSGNYQWVEMKPKEYLLSF